eukprot:scaffold14974_cov195-Amphora_coffeaeformis.AAC.64
MHEQGHPLLSLQHFKLFGIFVGTHHDDLTVVGIVPVRETHQTEMRSRVVGIDRGEVGQTTLGQHVPNDGREGWFEVRTPSSGWTRVLGQVPRSPFLQWADPVRQQCRESSVLCCCRYYFHYYCCSEGKLPCKDAAQKEDGRADRHHRSSSSSLILFFTSPHP